MSTTSTPVFVHSWYGYVPEQAPAIAFVVMFALSTYTHIGQAVYFRTWWTLYTICLCGVFEITGWACRLWSHDHPDNITAFQIQAVTTIVGPTALLAASITIFSEIVDRLGPGYSRLSHNLYHRLFTSCDLIALAIQGAGGITTAVVNSKGGDGKLGDRISIVGIAFQLVVITAFIGFAIEFAVRYFKDAPVKKNEMTSYLRTRLTGRLKIMFIALAFNIFCLFIRAIYRLAELSGGWHGPIIRTPIYFYIMEALMIGLASWTFNFVHPGYFLGPGDGLKNDDDDCRKLGA